MKKKKKNVPSNHSAFSILGGRFPFLKYGLVKAIFFIYIIGGLKVVVCLQGKNVLVLR